MTTPDADFQSLIEPAQGDLHVGALYRSRNPYRRLKLLLAGLLSAIIAGLAFYFATPTQYSARALILMAKNAPFVAFQADIDDRKSDPFIKTQIELIRSPAILNRVLEDAEAAKCAELRESVDPIAHLQARLQISQIGDSDLYEISYASASAQDAASIVNAVASKYLSTQPDAARLMTYVIWVLDEELESREADLTQLYETVLQLSRETHSPNPFSRDTTSRNEDRYDLTSDLRRNASGVDLELALLDAEQRRLESSPSTLPDVDALVELDVQNHPTIIESQLRVNELQSQVDQLQEPTGERETDENDASAELKRELEERQAALNELKKDQRDLLRREHAELHAQERFQTLKSLRDKIAALNVKKDVLSTRLDAAEQQLEADEGNLIKLEFTLAELDREKQVFELIAARKLAGNGAKRPCKGRIKGGR